MRMFQFAFGTDPKAEDFRPENYPARTVVYTGTHDNDTTVGWFQSKGKESTRSDEEIEAERKTILEYIGTEGEEIHWDMIGCALDSNADTAMVPLQEPAGSRYRGTAEHAGPRRWQLGVALFARDVDSRDQGSHADPDRGVEPGVRPPGAGSRSGQHTSSRDVASALACHREDRRRASARHFGEPPRPALFPPRGSSDSLDRPARPLLPIAGSIRPYSTV